MGGHDKGGGRGVGGRCPAEERLSTKRLATTVQYYCSMVTPNSVPARRAMPLHTAAGHGVVAVAVCDGGGGVRRLPPAKIATHPPTHPPGCGRSGRPAGAQRPPCAQGSTLLPLLGPLPWAGASRARLTACSAVRCASAAPHPRGGRQRAGGARWRPWAAGSRPRTRPPRSGRRWLQPRRAAGTPDGSSGGGAGGVGWGWVGSGGERGGIAKTISQGGSVWSRQAPGGTEPRMHACAAGRHGQRARPSTIYAPPCLPSPSPSQKCSPDEQPRQKCSP